MSDKECFKYRKKGHYAKDCCALTTSNKKKSEESTEEAKCIRLKRNQAKAVRLITNHKNDDFDFKPYLAS